MRSIYKKCIYTNITSIKMYDKKIGGKKKKRLRIVCGTT